MSEPKYCAQCFKEEGVETGKLIGGVCSDCYKKVKGDESVSAEGMPVFANYEEMLAFVKNANKDDQISQRVAEGKKKNRPPKGHPPVDTAVNSGEVADSLIYQTIHYYVREGDSIEALRKDVKEERKIRNTNVLLFIHDHTFGTACSDKCKEVK